MSPATVAARMHFHDFDRSSGKEVMRIPRYKLLYEALRNQILEGLLAPNTRLPSSRQLAKQLNLSRNTTIAALNQLCAEGYAEARPASGIFVLSTLTTRWQKSLINRPLPTATFRLSTRGKKIYEDIPKKVLQGAFTPGIPDLSLFPFGLWQRYLVRCIRNPQLKWQSYSQQGGLKELRQTVAAYLRVFRGIECSANQILITHGTQNSLNLISSLLTDQNDRVWIENPGYPGARSAFIAADLQIIGQPLDQEGIAPARSAWKNPPRLIYVTPSHQYPFGMMMSAARRQQLLIQAADLPTWFIEDDYDSEFRFEGNPVAAMQALAPSRVIYLGTFSKTLFPSIRIGYMVLPENYLDAFRFTQARHQREPSYILQSALNNFIQDGHYSTHVRKMRQIYQQRKDQLVAIFRENLGNQVQLHGTDTGLHLTITFPLYINSLQIEAQALEQGIGARSLKHYYLPNSSIPLVEGLVLGFGNTDSKTILRSANILLKLLKKALNSKII
ncbi:MAG: PLP-dependent aminotransferase family protein [Proteobacteria bacterium]|nr:PLP-dependent aminotransferase family protein [Pseudomonadota bacterium]